MKRCCVRGASPLGRSADRIDRIERQLENLTSVVSELISGHLVEDSPNARPVDYEGARILLPSHSQYYPRLEALRWHRENVFGLTAVIVQ